MYDLIDRPVASLATADREALMRMRRWVHALTLAGDAAEGRRDPFDNAMRLIDRHSSDDIAVARPCAPLVGDSEAVLVSLCRLARGDRGGAHALAGALVGERAAGRLATLLAIA